MAIKTIKQIVKFVHTFFFVSHLPTLRPTLGHWQGGSLTHLMLITALFQVQPEGHGSLVISLVIRIPKPDRVHQWNSSRKPSDSEYNVLSHCVTLPESVLETIDHRLSSFFSGNYRSFSLTLKTFYILFHYYYSNFKQINVGMEMLR